MQGLIQVPKPTEVISCLKGDILTSKNIPQWAKHIIGDHPSQYYWLHPGLNGDIKIMRNVRIEKFGPEIILNFE